MSARPIRILICDDHTVVREGTRHIFEDDPEFTVVAEAANGEAAVEAAVQLAPDVAIMDIRMPGLNGIEATKQIQKRAPETSVLVLTAYADESYVSKLLSAGASGYVLKTLRADELRDAVRSVHAGETVLDGGIATRMAVSNARVTNSDAAQPELTRREMDVLREVCNGLRNKEIAQRLGVSVRTVEGHLEAIFGRLGVNSRTEAAIYAVSQDWFEDVDIEADNVE